MNDIVIRKAERKKAKLRLALIGPTGSGKTYSALLMAFGIGKKIGLIDTENGSGDLYANLGDYDVITLRPPYTVSKYREAIRAFEAAGYDVIIIDSLSHAWAGAGGLLDRQGQLESSGKFRNSFATWREITPEHNKLVEEMLGCSSHIIATVRAKTEYVLDKDDRGKSVPRKIGLSPVQRDGLEYEFTVVMDVNENHYAIASKDRTDLFDRWSDKIDKKTGAMLLEWLEFGKEPEKPIKELAKVFAARISASGSIDELDAVIKDGSVLMERMAIELPDWLTRLTDRIDTRRAFLSGEEASAEDKSEVES